jgi:GNAT superfamily N-acetyltransferase
MNDTKIRFLNPEDISKLDAFFIIYNKDNDWRVSLDMDDMADTLSDDSNYIGAVIDDDLVGVISVGGAEGAIEDAESRDALISDLYVIPQMRGKGIGAALVNAALDEASKEFSGKAYADILDDSLADYYAQFGFEYDETDGILSVSLNTREKEIET